MPARTRVLQNWLAKLPTANFNRYCALLALLWLLITIPLGIVLRPTITDFSQFYIGGIIARTGQWKSLYPIPASNSLDNAGLIGHSHAKPDWRKLCRRYGIGDYTHFILPPPSALLFIPLSYFDADQAQWIWTFFLTGCAWGIALISARMLRRIVGHSTKWEGVLIWLVVLSPVTARSIRVANVSPPIALFIGITLLILTQSRPRTVSQTLPKTLPRTLPKTLLGAISILFGAVLKYATLILTPLLIVTRSWRILFWLTLFGVFLIALTLFLAGTGPFIEFYQKILPTLSRPSAYPGNQSLPGLLSRIYGRPLPRSVHFTLTGMALISLIWIADSLREIWIENRGNNPMDLTAAVGTLLSWLLIFSPIAWEHWTIFLAPIWGWLLWETWHSEKSRYLAIACFIFIYFPGGIIQVQGIATYPIVLPEPFNSSQLVGSILLLTLGLRRLYRPAVLSTWKSLVK